MKDVRIDGQTGLPDLESCYDGLLQYHCQSVNAAPPWKLMKAQMKQESRFNPLAVSATGPVGLFQFTASTWKDYSQPMDDRRDIFKSTGAAVRYMRSLMAWAVNHNVNGEDVYRFALGAYNAGQGNLLKAMRAADAAGADPWLWANVLSSLAGILTPGKLSEVTDYVDRVMAQWKEYEGAG
jgi:membrane-bound lytic murein transglycosylase MltF